MKKTNIIELTKLLTNIIKMIKNLITHIDLSMYLINMF